MGYVPVYSSDSTLLGIRSDTARAIKSAGKIYVFGNNILQSDPGYGVHILDKTNPSQIRNKGFIHIKGNSEIAIKGSYLYANSYNDLVVVDISDWANAILVRRLPNAFVQGNSVGYRQYIPLPERNVYYDCMSLQSGIHVGWKKDSIYSNACYYR